MERTRKETSGVTMQTDLGGDGSSECNLLERRGRVGRGEEKWGDVGRTRSGQQTASTATNNGRWDANTELSWKQNKTINSNRG